MIHQEDAHKRGKAARNKGKNAELELARILRVLGFEKVRRGHVFDHESDLVGLPFIHVECKRQQKLNLYKAMEQAEEEAKIRNDGYPATMFRQDHGEWLVCLRLKDFSEILKGFIEWKSKE